MRYYQTKSGYNYKEYKNGKKKRISNQEYKKNVNKLKGGSTGNSNKLIKQLVGLKKKINKINELLNRKEILQEFPKNVNNNLNNNLNTAQKRKILAMIANHSKYKRNSSGPSLNFSHNLSQIIASELSSVDLKIQRLLSLGRISVNMIKQLVTVNNSDINYTKLENIEDFYHRIIAEHFPQIKKNNFHVDTTYLNNGSSHKLVYSRLIEAVSKHNTNELNANEIYGPIELWDVSEVTSMYKLFNNARKFNAHIGGWDVSSVTNMEGMFLNTRSFNRDISQWDVGCVTDMSFMFDGAESFDQDIRGWDVSNVTNMRNMFVTALSFNRDIRKWVVGSVTDMSYMFSHATSFNQDISRWDMSSVTNMRNMFYNCPIREEFKCK